MNFFERMFLKIVGVFERMPVAGRLFFYLLAYAIGFAVVVNASMLIGLTLGFLFMTMAVSATLIELQEIGRGTHE